MISETSTPIIQQFEMILNSVAVHQQRCSGDTRWQQEGTAGGGLLSSVMMKVIRWLLSLKANVCLWGRRLSLSSATRRHWRSRTRRKKLVWSLFLHIRFKLTASEKTRFHISATNSESKRLIWFILVHQEENEEKRTDSNVSQFPAERKTVEVHWWQTAERAQRLCDRSPSDGLTAFCLQLYYKMIKFRPQSLKLWWLILWSKTRNSGIWNQFVSFSNFLSWKSSLCFSSFSHLGFEQRAEFITSLPVSHLFHQLLRQNEFFTFQNQKFYSFLAENCCENHLQRPQTLRCPTAI